MDRSIKIAIIVACTVSLGLGLIWDRVIDAARGVLPAKDETGMGPDAMVVRVGDMRLPRPPGYETGGFSPKAAPLPDPSESQPSSSVPTPAPSPWPEHLRSLIKDGKYEIQAGDSWWKIAHHSVRFKHLGKTTKDWESANPSARLRPGELVNIPK